MIILSKNNNNLIFFNSSFTFNFFVYFAMFTYFGFDHKQNDCNFSSVHKYSDIAYRMTANKPNKISYLILAKVGKKMENNQ